MLHKLFKTIPCKMKNDMSNEERIKCLLDRLALLYEQNSRACYKELLIQQDEMADLSFFLEHNQNNKRWILRGEGKDCNFEYYFRKDGRIDKFIYNLYDSDDDGECNGKLFLFDKIIFDSRERFVSWEFIKQIQEDGYGSVLYKGEYDADMNVIYKKYYDDIFVRD